MKSLEEKSTKKLLTLTRLAEYSKIIDRGVSRGVQSQAIKETLSLFRISCSRSIVDYPVERNFILKRNDRRGGRSVARVRGKLVIITHRRVSLDHYRERRWLSCLLIESARERRARRAGKKGNAEWDERNGNRDSFFPRERWKVT